MMTGIMIGRRPTDGLRLQTVRILFRRTPIANHTHGGRTRRVDPILIGMSRPSDQRQSPSIHAVGAIRVFERIRIVGDHQYRGSIIRNTT